VEVVIRDKAGKPLPNAKVMVVAAMQSMQGMAPVTEAVEAKRSGDKYVAMLDLAKAGSWNMSVGIGAGGKTATVKWTVDAQ
jgi:hypothetical protein